MYLEEDLYLDCQNCGISIKLDDIDSSSVKFCVACGSEEIDVEYRNNDDVCVL